MAFPASPLHELDVTAWASTDLLNGDAGTAAARLSNSKPPAGQDEDNMLTASGQGWGAFLHYIQCDSPQHSGPILEPQQQQQEQQQQQQEEQHGQHAVHVAEDPSQCLHAVASIAPQVIETSAAAAKLANIFSMSHATATVASFAPKAHISGALGSGANAAMPALEHAQDADDDVFTQRQLMVIKKEEQCEAEQDNEQAVHLHDEWLATARSKLRARKAQQDEVVLKKAKKLELSAADLQQKLVAWERKMCSLSSEDAMLFSSLNLPKATLMPAMRRELDACGINGEPAASRYYYMNRGPQLVLRGIVRRITALSPAAYGAYLDICRQGHFREGCTT